MCFLPVFPSIGVGERGFNFSALNQRIPLLSVAKPVNLSSYTVMSEPFTLFVKDNFRTAAHEGVVEHLDIPATSPGQINAVLTWWEAQLSPQVSLSTGKDTQYAVLQNAHWKQEVQPLTAANGITVRTGDTAALTVYNDGHRNVVELEGVNGTPLAQELQLGLQRPQSESAAGALHAGAQEVHPPDDEL